MPVSERALRDELQGHPHWITDECIAWVRRQEEISSFTGARAAVAAWLREK